MKKLLKRLSLTLLLLLLLILGALSALLYTETGLRQLPRLVAMFTPYQLHATQLSGSLLGGFRAEDLHISGEGLNVNVAALDLHLDDKALWQKHIYLPQLHIRNAHIALPPASVEEPSPPSEPLRALPELHLPVTLQIDDVTLENITLEQDGQHILALEKLTLQAAYQQQQFTLQSALSSDKLDIHTLSANLHTTGDYPAQLQLDGIVHEAQQTFALTLAGSLLQPQLTIRAAGQWVTLDAQADAVLNLAQQSLEGKLHWQDLSALAQYHSPKGTLTVNGAFDALQLTLDTQAHGQDIPPVQLQAQTLLRPDAARELNVIAHLLDGQVTLTGDVHFAPLSWDNTLHVEKLNLAHFNVDGKLEARLHTRGDQESALLEIQQLNGKIAGYPLQGTGSVLYSENTVHAEKLNIRMADNQLDAHGTLSPSEANLHATLQAPSLHKLLPDLQGTVTGKVSVAGNPQQPEIRADLNWKTLKYAKLFSSKQGKVQLSGTLPALKIQLALDGQGQDIPPFSAQASALLQDYQALNDVLVQLKALDGTADIRGKVLLDPLAWDVTLESKNLNPKVFLPELNASLNSQLHSQGQLQPQLQTALTIKALSGSWQKQKLAGQGVITLTHDKVAIDQLHLHVGNNQLSADGSVTPSALDLKLKLNAPQLHVFYPPLAGALQLDGELTGKPELPTVKLNASGRQLKFADHHIQQLNAKIHSHLQGNGVFNNHLEAKGVQTAGQKWQSVQLQTQGTFQQHELKLNTTGGESNLQTRVKGGFRALDQYLGEIQALNVQHQNMQLKLNRPAQLHYQPSGIKLQNFCLVDQYSDLCLDLEQSKALSVKYKIKALDPKSFAPFIPQHIRVQTVVRGEGEMRQNERGVWAGNSQLRLDNGSVNVRLPDQPPLNIPITNNSGVQLQLNGQNLKSALRLNLGHIGQVEGNINLQNFHRLQGNVRVNMPDLGVWRTFVPKVSTLQGRLQGQMNLGGTLQKPEMQGQIELQKGLVTIPAYATELQNISLRLLAQKTGQIDIQGNIGTPDGNMKTQGVLYLSPLKLNLQLAGKDMLIANAKNMKVSIDPKFDIQIDPKKGINVHGEIVIPKANISIPDTSSRVNRSDDVVLVGSRAPKKKTVPATENSPFYANIGVKLGNAVYFKNRDVNIRLRGGIQLRMRPREALSASGKIEVANGVYTLYGQELDIRRGSVTFTGNNIANPVVDILALRKINDVEVGASIKGAVSRLKLNLISNPNMPDSSVLSYLMFGRAPDGAMDRDGLMNAAANMALGAIMPDLASSTGLDVLDVNLNGLKAGKNITEDLYVGLKSDFFTSITEFIAKYHFNKRLRVEATAAPNNKQVEFIYEYEKD